MKLNEILSLIWKYLQRKDKKPVTDNISVVKKTNANSKKYTCPCCGYKVFDREPGSYDICPICFWEDDRVQLFHIAQGGANINLIDAQNNFEKFGAKEKRLIEHVRKPHKSEKKDPKWRKIDLNRDQGLIPPFRC